MRGRARTAAELLGALGTMVVVETCLRTVDLPTTCRWLDLDTDLASPAPVATVPAELPPQHRRAVRVHLAVVSRWPLGDTCLRRCLLVGRRLRTLRPRPVLRIGVSRGPGGEFAAHSWLELDGRTLDPQAVAFTPLGSMGHGAGDR